MKVLIDIRASLEENAARYYERAKKLRAKAMQVTTLIKKEKKKQRSWFEETYYMKTTNGFLALAGRSATQNEMLVSKRFEKGDLFFHADVQGGSVVILKRGEYAEPIDQEEAAKFAVCYSRAWSHAYASLDAYAATREQVKKYSHGEYVPKGGFVIEGQRRWYKNLPLQIVAGIRDGTFAIGFNRNVFTKSVILRVGSLPKEEVANILAERFEVEPTDVLHLLPSGTFAIEE